MLKTVSDGVLSDFCGGGGLYSPQIKKKIYYRAHQRGGVRCQKKRSKCHSPGNEKVRGKTLRNVTNDTEQMIRIANRNVHNTNN